MVVILEPCASAEKWAHLIVASFPGSAHTLEPGNEANLIDARMKEKVADVENHVLELTTGHDHQFNARQQ